MRLRSKMALNVFEAAEACGVSREELTAPLGYDARRLVESKDGLEHLISLLESRLDAIVYRSKFVPTPWAARQFVNHGHVTVNGKRVTIPSYMVQVGDAIAVRSKSKEMANPRNWT